MKINRGITLVALIITIIILLILAVVAISAVTGNGIIAHAKNAKNDYSIAQEKEELSLNILEWKLNNQNKEQTLKDFLGEKYGESNVKLNTDKSITVTLESGRKYKVNENGEVTLLDGTIEEPTPVEPKVSLDKKQINESIETGKTKTITLTATLENATGKLTWLSSNTDIAEISGDGNTRTITLKLKGTATITVSYGEYKDTCTITVSEEKMISFKAVSMISGQLVDCKAKEGMTWGEFVSDPKYNTIGLTVWNDIIIYARSALVKTAENNFTIIQANAFWSDDKKSKKFFFTWDKIDNSIEGRFILGYPTTDVLNSSKDKFKSEVEAEGGTITDWTVE